MSDVTASEIDKTSSRALRSLVASETGTVYQVEKETTVSTLRNDIEKATVEAESEAWNHAEDQHELTERQVDEEVAASKKVAMAAKTDPKSTESKGKPDGGEKSA